VHLSPWGQDNIRSNINCFNLAKLHSAVHSKVSGAQVDAVLCYDRPPEHFAPTSVEKVHSLTMRLKDLLQQPVHPTDCLSALYAADDAAKWPADVQQARRVLHPTVVVQLPGDSSVQTIVDIASFSPRRPEFLVY
jgi:hypothetical protein